MENQKKVLFSYSEFPWEELKSIGLSEESFLDLPKDSIDRIFTGNLSPLMKLKFMDRDGNPMQLPESMKLGQNPDGVVPTKFRLTRDAEGKVHVELHPRQSDISRKIGDSELSQKDINRLKDGESLMMTVRQNGKDEKCYIQLDHDLNIVHAVNKKDIRIPNAIGDVVIGEKQAQQIREGKPVELEVGDTKVTVGVDINARNGFRIVEGDMDLWKQRKLEQWDRITPGVKGYWKTSENGWEYELHHEREEKLQQTQTMERGTGRTLSQEENLEVSMRQSRGMRR